MQCSCEEMHVCMMGFPDMRFQVKASCFSQVKSHRLLSHCFCLLTTTCENLIANNILEITSTYFCVNFLFYKKIPKMRINQEKDLVLSICSVQKQIQQFPEEIRFFLNKLRYVRTKLAL